ncbi:MAG: hypothetical protein ABFQ95_01285 [Pseudomonadota bacterium]
MVRFAFAALALTKIFLIWQFGPLYLPDSGLYLSFATKILTSTSWLSHANFITEFRIIGYPALIAFAKLINSSYFDYIIITAQSCLSLVAIFLLFRLSYLVTNSTLASIFVGFAYFSASLTWDLSMLTDSFYASLFSITLTILATHSFKKTTPSMLTALGLGTLLATSILIRESGLYFCLFPLTILTTTLLVCKLPAAKKICTVALFLLPICSTYTTYTNWNYYRTGHSFLTTGNQSALLQPIVKVGRYTDRNIFDGNHPLDVAASSFIKKHEWSEVFPLISKIREEYSLSSYEISDAVKHKFFQSLARHPHVYIKYILIEMIYASATVFNPANGLLGILTSEWIERPHSGAQLDINHVNPILKIANRAFYAVSVILFALFCLLIPAKLLSDYVTRIPITPRFIALLQLWFTFLGMHGAYWLVHWEQRYTVGVSGIFFVVLFGVIQDLLAQRKLHKNKTDSPTAQIIFTKPKLKAA